MTSRVLQYLWLGPLLFAGVVLGGGFALKWSIDDHLRHELAGDLRAIRDGRVAAIRTFLRANERAVQAASLNPTVQRAIRQLVEAFAEGGIDAAASHPAQAELRAELEPLAELWGFESFVLVKDGVVIAASRPESVGVAIKQPSERVRERLSKGRVATTSPELQSVDRGSEEVPTMWAAMPLRDEHQRQLGTLAFRVNPKAGFTSILEESRFGRSGETYAFDRRGFLLSESRFDRDLREGGLLDSGEDSILRVQVRDPGRDIREKPIANETVERFPLTRMAEDAIGGVSGVDVDGYGDYRGVTVIGAWTWLPEHGMGIATEVERSEGYETLTLIRGAIWTLFGALMSVSIVTIVSTRVIARLHRRATKAERLGQYTLEKKIGQGGMGDVYRARHALLRRPTAVKVMRGPALDERTRRRFEREVQATSQLTHPNTIAVYDYGHTEMGTFYYAMEYLSGVTLQELVRDAGPQPQERVFHILRQMCGSLAEAHAAGLVHRDVKPSNVMLCQRGGLFDVVKVLDFGLVKDLTEVTATDGASLQGTPQYMAPEAISTPHAIDARSDLFAVAAVAYILLTGRELLEGLSLITVLTRRATEEAPRPSEASQRPIDPDFEAILMRCMNREPAKRPAHAGELLELLSRLEDHPALSWSQADARRWWSTHANLLTQKMVDAASVSASLDIDVESRISGTEPTVLASNLRSHLRI